MKKGSVLCCLAAVLAFFTAGVHAEGDGAGNYKKLCARCHGDAGRGDGPAAKLLKNQKMGDLSDKAAMSKLSDQDLHKVISEGGAAVGKSKVMPAHKDKLNESEMKAVVEYVKSFQK